MRRRKGGRGDEYYEPPLLRLVRSAARALRRGGEGRGLAAGRAGRGAPTWVLLAAILLLILLYDKLLLLSFSLALGSEVPVAVIASDSMVPTLKRGDVVLIRAVPPESVKPGDVIAFNKVVTTIRKPSEEKSWPITVHRVLGVYEGWDGRLYFRTKGDANRSPDPWYVPQDGLLGVVVGKLPRTAVFLMSAAGKGLLVAAALILLLATRKGSKGKKAL